MIVEARHSHPFQYLGQHQQGDAYVQRIFNPHASSISMQVNGQWKQLKSMPTDGFFEGVSDQAISTPYLLKVESEHDAYEVHDVYSFSSTISNDELFLFGQGNLKEAYKMLGAQVTSQQGVAGVRFAVWAPNAECVSVVGNFNGWDGRIHPMRALATSGVWELFIPLLTTADLYKFQIRNRDTDQVLEKCCTWKWNSGYIFISENDKIYLLTFQVQPTYQKQSFKLS